MDVNAWVEIDGVREAELPPEARDGRSGDRFSFVDGGVLFVRKGRATFVRGDEVLGVVEGRGCLYVLVPRRPPALPWLEVKPGMLASTDGGALARAGDRLRQKGGGGGGYREAVRRHRQGMSRSELAERVAKREPVPGALEIVSARPRRAYPGLFPVQAIVALAPLAVTYPTYLWLLLHGLMPCSDLVPDALEVMLQATPVMASPMIGIVVAYWLGRAWRRVVDGMAGPGRVLVLAPDGCVAGFTDGARALSWSEVGAFRIEPTPRGVDALVAVDRAGAVIGWFDAAYLSGPLPLTLAIAEAYRRAAST